MKLESVQIKNFRMLQDFETDLEDVLTLVIGKNNSGKRNLMQDKFILQLKNSQGIHTIA